MCQCRCGGSGEHEKPGDQAAWASWVLSVNEQKCKSVGLHLDLTPRVLLSLCITMWKKTCLTGEGSVLKVEMD